MQPQGLTTPHTGAQQQLEQISHLIAVVSMVVPQKRRGLRGFQQIRSGATGRGSRMYRHGLAGITRVRTAWPSALEKGAPIR